MKIRAYFLFLRNKYFLLKKLLRNWHVNTREYVYLLGRWMTAPFEKMERYIPKEGNMLDIGCGYGLFSFYLAEKSRGRHVSGIDPDKHRIRFAKKIAPLYPNTTFSAGIFRKTRKAYDGIFIIDVLYLLDDSEKKQILIRAASCLKEGGSLFVKINQKERSLGFLLCYIQELMAVILTGKTFSHSRTLHFRSITSYERLFRESGLKVTKKTVLATPFFHPHCLFVLRVDGSRHI